MSQQITALKPEPLAASDGDPQATSIFDRDLDLIGDVKVKLGVVVGECELTVRELFELREESVLALDRDVDAPVDILLEGRVVARGTLVAVDDNFGVKITSIENQR